MKSQLRILFFSLITALSSSAFSYEVLSAFYSDGKVKMTLQFPGGDKDHQFSIQLDPSCDASGDIAGVLLDTDFDDTGDRSQVVDLELDLALDSVTCDQKISSLYLRIDRKHQVQIEL